MRIGTFLLGSIVGAATVIYLSDRQNRSMMFSAFSSPTESLGKMLSKTKEKAVGTLLNATAATGLGSNGNNIGTMNSSSQAGTSTTSQNSNASMGTSFAGKGGLAQVEKIVNQDPNLRSTVNEILSDSGKTSAALQ